MCDPSNPLKDVRDAWTNTTQSIFGSPKSTPDPTAERVKAEAEATIASNDQIVANAKRKRLQAGKVATGAENILASGSALATPTPLRASTVLGSGGQNS